MTNSGNRKDISQVLWSNSQINELVFKEKDFNPTNIGHGIFVKTLGQDVVYDLRLANEKPFWGHTHPLLTQHNFQKLEHKLEEHYYSVPNTEFVSIIETFQKVHFIDILKPDFKITYHNVVINFDEKLLEHDFQEVYQTVKKIIESNPETYFWLVEKDILLLSESHLFNFQDLMNTNHVHLCFDSHFISSVFIYSHHLFSEDSNIQLFLAIKKLVSDVVAANIHGKNEIDYKTIDEFLSSNENLPIKRMGRYIFVNSTLNKDTLNNNGILFTEPSVTDKTVFAFPMACTKAEIMDVLERIKNSL